MRVLVTGAGGLIGRSVVADLLAAGHDVTAFDLVAAQTGADRTVIGDTTVRADVEQALADVDAVVHLAAIIAPDRAEAPEGFRANSLGTVTVLTLAADRGVRRIVIASSINAVGRLANPHDVEMPYYPIDEDVEADIADWYSLTKACDELTAGMVARRYGATVVALRFPKVQEVDRLRANARAMQADPRIARKEGWSYLSPDDAARAVRLALTEPIPQAAHAVLLAADDSLLTMDTADAIATYVPGAAVRRALVGQQSGVDATRAKTLFGFAPRFSVHSPD